MTHAKLGERRLGEASVFRGLGRSHVFAWSVPKCFYSRGDVRDWHS
jgi:hypothetical protein